MNLTHYINAISSLGFETVLVQRGNHFTQYVNASTYGNMTNVWTLQRCLKDSMSEDVMWCVETWQLDYLNIAEGHSDNCIYNSPAIDLQEYIERGSGWGFGDPDSECGSEIDQDEGPNRTAMLSTTSHATGLSSYTSNTQAMATVEAINNVSEGITCNEIGGTAEQWYIHNNNGFEVDYVLWFHHKCSNVGSEPQIDGRTGSWKAWYD